MRNLVILIIAIFALASCKSTYDSAAAYDDVYYTPKKDVVSSATSNPLKVVYSGSTTSGQYEQSTIPQSEPVPDDGYKSYEYMGDTLPAASSQDDEYYYVEDSELEYYDYDYATRIDRFHNPAGNFGYYAPVYGGYAPSYGSSFSMSYGYGFPSSYFSLGFGYGWGGGYYNPWCYDPWYCSPYYGYPSYGWGYGSSYWTGYNHGYWNGYYAGGGGYYPGNPGGGETIYPEYYYGPRNSRGSSIVGSSDARGSRVDDGSGDSDVKNSFVSGRGSRTGNDQASGVELQNTQRASRTLEPGQATGNDNSRATRTEKMTKPAEAGAVATESSRNGRTTGDIQNSNPEVTRTYAKPSAENNDISGNNRSIRSQEKPGSGSGKQYTKPSNTSSRGDIYSRTKRYAKPASESLSGTNSRSGNTKRYTSPNANRPRSSNEYTVPQSKPTRTYTTPSRSNNSFNSSNRNTRSYSSPSRSNRSYSSPSRSYSQPSRSYSSPSRKTSSPSRSSGSYSSPSRSSGSSSSGSRSSGSSSGGGRRGR